MKKWALPIFSISFLVVGFINGVFFARERPDIAVPDIVIALESAIDEVQKGCPQLFDYAITLEKENSKLRATLKGVVIKKK